MKTKYRSFIYEMTVPALIILTGLSLFPFIYTIGSSFTDYYLLAKEPAKFIGLDNYIEIMKDDYFRVALKNTVLFTILCVFFETVLGFLFALFVNSIKRCNKLIRTLVLVPMLLPPVTVALIWQTMLSNNNGIINQMLNAIGIGSFNWLMDVKLAFGTIVVIDIWQNTPLTFLLCYAAMQSIPQDQYEAADMEGANGIQKLFYITIPNMIAGLTMVILLRTIDTFRLFDKVNILTKGGPANSTTTITQYIYQFGTRKFQMGYASATSVIMTVIVLLLSAFYLYKNLKEMSE